MRGAKQNARVRADTTFPPAADGGAVVTAGSMARSLSRAGYANDGARLTGTVLRRLLAPFEGCA